MQSFFGAQPTQSKTTVVSKVVKKVIVRPHPPTSTSSPSSSLSRQTPSLTNLKRTPSTSASPIPRGSKKSKLSATSSSVSTPRSPAGSARRAKSPKREVRVRPESDESESDEDSDRAARRRVGSSVLPGDEEVGRNVFSAPRSEEGEKEGEAQESAWKGFVGTEQVVRGENGPVKDVKNALDKYIAYFPQEGFEKAEPLPTVELLYPSGCKERFVLLTVTSAREYNPIGELRAALRLILEHYIPPSHAHIFGTLSDPLAESASLAPTRVSSPHPTTLATPPPDGSPAAGSVSTPGAHSGTDHSTPGGVSHLLPSLSSVTAPASPSPAPAHVETIGDALRRALAPNRRDGPGLVRAVERYNAAMAEMQRDGSLKRWLANAEDRSFKQRQWSVLVDFVNDQAYSRAVGPYSEQLEHHPKHSDKVAAAISEKEDAYGELRHNFMSKIIEQTGLGPDSVFVDLGSGVGNCVVQAALQAGCKSYGFELLPVPSQCARAQLAECKRRWAMWCLSAGEAQVHEGDFREHKKVPLRLKSADVVLVNNEVFPSSLNQDLTHLFLELKEGAMIVSLKPFVPEGFRMNDSNCDSFAAILRSTPHTYLPGWVSWKGDSGRYYVQTIDRGMRKRYEDQGRSRRRG